ncbi:MAG: hypothetical protein AB1665_00990 [Candidatus Thermoplasmatota archaeon]
MARWNCEGLEGLPLKLMIVAVVLGISLPIVYTGFRAYDISRLEGAVATEAQRVLSMAEMLHRGGVGNAETITIKIPNGALARVEYLAIGGAFGTPEASSVRYLVGGSTEQRLSASIQIVSVDNEAVYMGSGVHELHIECVVLYDAQVIQARLL